ncbi:MAG: cysteine desulfurase family protein [Actinomycetota bacterium]|nr:cysteine desulfurase [Actinomycetota bacterium]
MHNPTTLYLDNAATTPLRPEARAAMEPFLDAAFANASSLYASAREARKGIEVAREQLAAAVGARPEEVVFTGSGTEADNLALKGAAWHAREQGRDGIVIGVTEHEAVAKTAEWLGRVGFRVRVVGVDGNGVVSLDELREAVDEKTAIVSVMWANNEVGTVQPVAEIADIARSARALFHSDAVQALRFLPVDSSRADLTAFSAHKVGGPKGVGALIVRRGTKIQPLIHGGGQERGLRSSTYNVAGIIGFGAAVGAVAAERSSVVPSVEMLRDRLQAELCARITGVHVNGAGAPRLAGHVNVSIEGIEGEPLILLLDGAGVAASSGSACQSGSTEPSHVLVAMGVSRPLATSALRLTLGTDTTEADVDRAVSAVADAVVRLRR